jgi:signal transduction histidine kinase
VADDGCGLDRRPEQFHGGGMLSMRERAELIGGSVSILDNPGGGTTVRLHVPLPGSTA